MLKTIFKNYLKEQKGSKRQINNIKRSNEALLIRISTILNTLIEYNVDVDYYVPIYGNNFGINNKLRKQTLDILKKQNIISVKLNQNGNESYQSSFNKNNIKRNDINNPTPKSYCFTQYGYKLIQDKELLNEIKTTIPTKKTTKYTTPEELIDEILKKSAEDNISLTFKLTKPLPVVVNEYFNLKKEEWKVTEKNYKSKYKQAESKVLSVIRAFNNKMLSFNIRMYSALSFCPKELRKYILTPDGEQIDEGFDINSSIYTLLGNTLELYLKENNISIPAKFYQEKEKMLKLCFSKEHIYDYIGRWNNGHWNKPQIKPHNMEVVFSNNEDIQKREEKNTIRNQIKDFLQTQFPTFWQILINFKEQQNKDYEQQMKKYNQFIEDVTLYNAHLINHIPQHVDKPKQVKSTIWRYFQRVETTVMLKLKQQMEEKFNTTAYWIHDCLYFKKSILTSNFKAEIKTAFKSLLNTIKIDYINNSIIFNQNQNQLEYLPILCRDSVVEEESQIMEERGEYDILVDEIDKKVRNEVILYNIT